MHLLLCVSEHKRSFARIYIIRRRMDLKREKCLEVLNLREKCNFLLEKFGGMKNS